MESNKSVNMDICRNQGLQRLHAHGALQLKRISNQILLSDECSIILAPYGANEISLAFTLAASKLNNQSNPLIEQSGTMQSCEDYIYRIEIYECQDLSCGTRNLLARMCNSAHDVSGQVRASTGMIGVTFSVFGNVSFFASFDSVFYSAPFYESILNYVPGQQILNLTVIRVDGMQFIIPADTTDAVLSVVLCSALEEPESCNIYTSLIPAAFYGFNLEGFCLIEGKQMFACGLNETSVALEISLVGSSFTPLRKLLDCLPCGKGESRQDSQLDGTWTCLSCAANQYVIDPNNPHFQCQLCPQGAACNGNDLVGLVSGSEWVPDLSLGIYRLVYCPKVRKLVCSRRISDCFF